MSLGPGELWSCAAAKRYHFYHQPDPQSDEPAGIPCDRLAVVMKLEGMRQSVWDRSNECFATSALAANAPSPVCRVKLGEMVKALAE